MCRIAAYRGPLRSLSELLLEPPHSLVAQARAPRELPAGTIGGDGFGVGFYAAPGDLPARYRSVLPIWSDDNFGDFAPHVRSGCVVASIRAAVRDMPVGLQNTPPFVRGRLALVHNGELGEFHRAWLRPLRACLTTAEEASLVGNTDSEHLVALLAHELGDGQGADALASALQRVAARVRELASRLGEKAIMNLGVSDGDAIVVTRFAVGSDRPAPSLYVAHDALGPGSGMWFASEKLFEAASWREVPEGSMVIATGDAPPSTRTVDPTNAR